MRARLTAVQQALVLLPVASLILAVVSRPHLDNRRFLAALDEMKAFRESFDRPSVEASLRKAAEEQGLVSLSTVPAAVRKSDGPKKVQIAEAASPIRPLTFVQLNDLGAVYAHAQPQTQLELGAPDAAAMGPALAWRLARTGEAGPFTITGVELTPAEVTAADVDLETEVAQLASSREKAQASVEQATKRLEMEDSVYEARRKRHLPWKVIVKSIEARKAAKDELDARTAALTTATQSYESAAARALEAKKPLSVREVPELALANVHVEHGAQKSTLQIPVRLERRSVVVPSLQHSDFAATREAGLWEEVKPLEAAAAEEAIRDHFNWHYSYVEVAGIKLGGMLILQLLPCFLPALLLLLLARIRAAASSYSPFTTEVRGALPQVGLKARSLDGVALVLLPVLAGISASTALLVVGQVPVLPVIAAVACLLLGASAFGKLGDLQELVASVVHSQSYPPPPEPKAVTQP